MAVDSRFTEISEYLAELLVDSNPSLPSSYSYPDLSRDGDCSVDDVIRGDRSSQNVNFLAQGIGIGDFEVIPPVSGEEFVPLSTSESFGEALSLNSGLSPGGESSSYSSDDCHDSDPILKYINQLLMEEDKEDNPWFFRDETALRKTEKSFYEALGEKYPQLPTQNLDSDASCLVDGITLGKDCDLSSSGDAGTGISSNNSIDPNFVRGPCEFLDRALLHSSYFGDETIQQSAEALQKNPPGRIVNSNGDDSGHSDVAELFAKNIFKDSNSVLLFKKGLKEASKFLPSTTQLFRDLDDHSSVPKLQKNEIQPADAGGTKGLKNHVRDDLWGEEGRACKQTAVAGDEGNISEMFDKVLLCKTQAYSSESSSESSKNSRSSGKKRTSKGSKVPVKKQISKSTVDLRSLLVLCAEAVNGHDLRTANELLKQIRDNSSSTGDGSERLAHYFANGLEARIAGNEGDAAVFYTSTTFKKASAADMLKAYHASITAFPFLKFPILFSGHMISKLAANTEVLHIIDFGMALGFHWPIVIQKISERPIGPPKLRMTGIEYPVPGFRPAQRIEEAGRRLAQYCDRFRVPFEFNAVASQEWESIKIEDLKIQSGEMIAVNCLNRLKNLLDDMGEEDSPRDAMLDLVRRINPDIFVNSTPNGSYNSPFFLTRFREALLHQSGVYDMLDITLSADSYERQIIEREFYGREIMNVIACEGRERIERPETYKQWHVRHLRAGFKPLPLDQEIMTYLRSNIRKWYHKDFMVDEYNNWMLLGWRGRIMSVSSCWVPC